MIHFNAMLVLKIQERYILLKRLNETVDEARYFKKTEICWNKVATSHVFGKMEIAMPSIMATKRKHSKK